jgi:hypothetical protein
MVKWAQIYGYHELFLKCHMSNFPVISWQEQATFQWDDVDVHLVLDQHG